MTDRIHHAPSQPLSRLTRYVEMREAKPLSMQDDRIHGIHFGTEWEGELRQSDIETALACIREQQAALKSVMAEVEWFVSRRKNLDDAVDNGLERSWADVLDEDLNPARAVLAKWGIE